MSWSDESELATRFRRASPEAIDEVRRRVRAIIGSRGFPTSREDRQDLQQEVMTQIWRAVTRSGFDLQGGFWGFVEVVTARRCIDWLRARRPEAALAAESPTTSGGPLEALLDAERTELARQALDRLGTPCRDLIRLYFASGHSYRQIAHLLGKSEGALRVQMYRCIREAKQILDRLDERPHEAGARDS